MTVRALPLAPPRANAVSFAEGAKRVPSGLIEYTYYACLVNSVMGDALGIPGQILGGAMLAILAACCVVRLESRAAAVYQPIAFPLACALCYLIVQLTIHNESLTNEYVRSFLIWSLVLVITQSLAVRPGFFRRFAVVTFLIGLASLPYLQPGSELERARLESVSIGNPNDLAAWFGFCAVYFMIAGTETRRGLIRVACWVTAVGCLGVVGLTVSRGTLLAVGIATLIIARRLLRPGLTPLLILLALSGVVYESGLFERVASSYAERGLEETGRLAVWPLAIERFVGSPLVGVGASQVDTYVPEKGREITPHNAFLFIGLASGIIPLAFFAAYWWRAARAAFHSSAQSTADGRYQLPLLAYAFVVVQSGGLSFMSPWVVATLSLPLAAGAVRPARRIVAPRMRPHNDPMLEPFARRGRLS